MPCAASSLPPELRHRSAADCYGALADGKVAGKTWLVTDTRRVTFGDLRDRIDAIAGWLPERGVGVGDRIVVATRDDAEAALLFVALICSGVTVVNLDPDTGAERAAALISKADPTLLLIDREIAAKWHPHVAVEQIVEIAPAAPSGGSVMQRLTGRKAPLQGLHALLAAAARAQPAAEIPEDTLAYVLFTSGTTSHPKGVSISHRALFSHLETLSRRFGYDADSRILNTLMLSHADGMIQGPVIGFYNRVGIHRPLRFEITTIEALLDAIYQLRITHMVAVPTMLALMLRFGAELRDAFRGGDFRLLISCGAQLEAPLQEGFESTFRTPMINVYGLTETVIGGVFAGPTGPSRVPGGIGMPEDCDLRVVGDDGSDVAVGQTGELWMRGSLLMSGYFREPTATAEVLRDGWLRTGDIARRDADGRYWIVGRVKSLIIRGGHNIHPEEVTQVLLRHPQVCEAVTFGMPDPLWGEVVAALVVVSAPLTAETVLRFCAECLESRKVPSHLRVVDALPRGRSGKVILDQARALLAAPHVAQDVPVSDLGEMTDRLLRVAARTFKTHVDRLRPTSTPDEVPGWDSHAHMELVVAVEQEFGLELSVREIITLDRLDRVLDLIVHDRVPA